jgi:hypothetical protein
MVSLICNSEHYFLFLAGANKYNTSNLWHAIFQNVSVSEIVNCYQL